MGLAIFLSVFVLAALGLLVAGVTRQNESIGTVQKIAPCSDRLKGLYAVNPTPSVTDYAVCN